MARLVGNERLTAQGHFQDTRHVELDLGQDGPRYDPGDILTVLPRQDKSAVYELLCLLGMDAEARIRIELADAGSTSGKHTAEASSVGWSSLPGVLCPKVSKRRAALRGNKRWKPEHAAGAVRSPHSGRI